MTSTLQQEAGRKLRFSAQRAMQVAQRLYEQGFITYMRTDSTTLSGEALTAARSQAREMYGDAYVPGPAPHLRAQGQERPGGPRGHPPGRRDVPHARAGRPRAERRRAPAVRVDLDAHGGLANGRRHRHQRAGAPGGQRPQWRGRRGRRPSSRPAVASSPSPVSCGPTSKAKTIPTPSWPTAKWCCPPWPWATWSTAPSFEPGSHTTQPPARYTEASLVKAMEELGVGRPSTYASVIATILDRGYVWKKGTALVPSFTAFAVVGLLERYFGNLVDYGFTASMEDDLDEIAAGREEALPWLSRFYFGTSSPGVTAPESQRRQPAATAAPWASRPAWPRTWVRSTPGRSTPSRSASAPTASRSWPGSVATGRTCSTATSGPRCPTTSAPTSSRWSGPRSCWPHRRMTGCWAPTPRPDSTCRSRPDASAPTCSWARWSTAAPSRGPRPSSPPWTPATLTFEQALQLLQIPRTVGKDPESGDDVVAHNGKFGPYLKKGTDTRSLTSEDQLLTVTLDEAQALFAQPKQRRGRTAAAPLRELGPDPATELPMVLKDGRFGPYVTDGTTNASLRKGDDVESITVERAAELLADRRAAGPSTRKKAAKKAPRQAKKAAKKTDQEDHEEGHARPRRRPKAAAKAAAPPVERTDVPARGRLLALEGIDGCGKSTQARALAAALGAILTHEPGATDARGHPPPAAAGARLRRPSRCGPRRC